MLFWHFQSDISSSAALDLQYHDAKTVTTRAVKSTNKQNSKTRTDHQLAEKKKTIFFENTLSEKEPKKVDKLFLVKQ